MGGKSGTTTQTVSIPPDVLARYNSVNAYAQNVAKTPFQPYTGQFVAGLTPTQQQGIQTTSQYAQAAQPYFDAATGQLAAAQQSAIPGISAAYQNIGAAQDVGQNYAQAATQNISGAQSSAMPYYGAATSGIGAGLQGAQPYQNAATLAALAGSQGVMPQNLNIGAYMSPYTQAVADTTYQALRQQQQQEMQGATANAIRSGAFGGDRAGLVAANLARQQQLATAQAMAPIYQQGYGQALGAAQQQQGVQLGAAQQNRAALQALASQLQGIGQQGFGQQMTAAQQMAALGQGLYGMGTGTGQALAGLGQQQYGQGLGAAQQLAALAQQGYGMGSATAQQLAALGTGAQQAGLQGAQAQIGAGTLEQQTQQADLTANYQQFLQERGYPFQVAQFLANIAMGTGALSGSTTQTQQPMPFFSDRRVKHDVKEIGKTHDGTPIYSFKYNGSDQTNIGLMAQDVEKRKPEAVYQTIEGIKGVDYKEATKDAERSEKYAGGLVPQSMGGAVIEPGSYARGGYNIGGDVIDPNDINSILAQQQQSFGPFGQGGLYGQGHTADLPFGGKGGIVPTTRLHTPKLATPGRAPDLQKSGLQSAMDLYGEAKKGYGQFQDIKRLLMPDEEKKPTAPNANPAESAFEEVAAKAPVQEQDLPKKEEESGIWDRLGDYFGFRSTGGVVPRGGFVKGGTAFSDPYKKYDPDEGQVPEEVLDIENDAELAKPDKPPSQTSQTGIGLGTILGLFLKDGGVVPRHGFATDGFVTDESMTPPLTEEQKAARTGAPALPLPPPTVIEEKPKGVVPQKRDMFEMGPTPDANFARSYTRTLKFEGSKPVIDNDGKLRRYGITPEEAGVSVEEINPSTAAPTYYKNYWLASGADKLEPNLAHVHFDTAVNSGVGRANQILKQSGGDPAKYLDIREQFLRDLAANDTKNKYRPHLEGWMNRVNQLRTDISGKLPETESQGIAPANFSVAENVAPRSETKGGLGGISDTVSGLMPSAPNTFEGKPQGWGDFATSKQFLIPFLSGLGTMAQSRSPFLGAAVLEGLGGGAQAYANLEKQQAEVARTRAEAGQIRAAELSTLGSIPNTAIVSDQYGRTIGVKVYVNGKLTVVSMRDFINAREAGRPYQVAPEATGPAGVSAPQIEAPDLGVGQPPPASTPQKEGSEFTVGQTGAPAPSGAPIYQEVPEDLREIALQNASSVQEAGFKNLQDPANNPFTSQEAFARDSQKDLMQRNTLATNLASLPREGLVSAGQFSAMTATPIVNYVNSMLKSFNVPVEIANPEDLGKAEVIEKISRILALRRADEAGQRANASFVETLKAVPTQANNPEGAAQLIADLYITQQREIDLDRYYRQMRQIGEQEGGLSQAESQVMGRGLGDQFAKRMEPVYAKEKQDLQKLYMMPITITDPKTGQKTQEYAISIIAKNGGQVPEKLKKAIISQGVSPDVFRYFSAQ